jgi:hypothetical protein
MQCFDRGALEVMENQPPQTTVDRHELVTRMSVARPTGPAAEGHRADAHPRQEDPLHELDALHGSLPRKILPPHFLNRT